MSRPLIRLGDSTSHGGIVIEASVHTDSGNIQVARIGDRVTCPRHSPGVFPIVTGDHSLVIDGSPVARDGDVIGCGAILIASQQATVDMI